MKRLTVVIILLGLLSIACSTQVATAIPTTPSTTPIPVLPALTPTPTTVRTSVVRMEYVHVRNIPSGASVGIVTKGTVVKIVDCDNTWCEIVEPAGYVWRGCLSDNPEHLGCRSK